MPVMKIFWLNLMFKTVSTFKINTLRVRNSKVYQMRAEKVHCIETGSLNL